MDSLYLDSIHEISVSRDFKRGTIRFETLSMNNNTLHPEIENECVSSFFKIENVEKVCKLIEDNQKTLKPKHQVKINYVQERFSL